MQRHSPGTGSANENNNASRDKVMANRATLAARARSAVRILSVGAVGAFLCALGVPSSADVSFPDASGVYEGMCALLFSNGATYCEADPQI